LVPAIAQQTLVPSRWHLEFETDAAGHSPSQTITLTSSDGSSLDFTPTYFFPNPSYTLEASSIHTPAVLTVTPIVPVIGYSRSWDEIRLVPTRGNMVVISLIVGNYPPGPVNATLSPSFIDWTVTQGNAPVTTEIKISSDSTADGGAGYEATAFSDTNWLKVNNATYSRIQWVPGQGYALLKVSCDCSQFPPGQYTGFVRLVVFGTATIPVTLTV